VNRNSEFHCSFCLLDEYLDESIPTRRCNDNTISLPRREMAYAQRPAHVAGSVEHERRSAAGSQISLQQSYLSPLAEEGWVLFSGSSTDEAAAGKVASREGSGCAAASAASSDLMAALQDHVAFPSHDGLGAFSTSTESESTHARIHAWRMEQCEHLRAELHPHSASESTAPRDHHEEEWIARILRRVFGLDHAMLEIVFGERFVDDVQSDMTQAAVGQEVQDEAYWEKRIDLSVIWSYVKSRVTRSETSRFGAKSGSASRCGGYARGRVSKRHFWDDATSVSSMGAGPMGEWGSV